MMSMDLRTFQSSLGADQPPANLPPLVEALWWDAHDAWDRAHTIAQDVPGREGAWVHGFLHRREGDLGNAGYWYRQAGKPVPRSSFDKERLEIVAELLNRA